MNRHYNNDDERLAVIKRTRIVVQILLVLTIITMAAVAWFLKGAAYFFH